MAKYSFEDIKTNTPRRKRSHFGNSDIKRVQSDINETKNQEDDFLEEDSQDEIDQHERVYNSWQRTPPVGVRASRVVVWGVAGIAILGLVIAFMGIFTGATIKLVPKQENGFIDGSFTAFISAENGGLSFQTMSVELNESKEIPATQERRVEDRASGTITIFNEFNNIDQRLIKNTRFETPTGLIYRIQESVVVPGMNPDGSPGSIDVVVYADEPGDRYNIGLTDFTIPGFQGDPRFNDFYARSKTPMTGGFLGTVKTAPLAEIRRAQDELKQTLASKLQNQARAEKPEGLVLYDDASFISYDSEPIVTETERETVLVSQRGVLEAMLFNRIELSRFVAGEAIASYDGARVSIDELETLVFAIIDKSETEIQDPSIQFTLSGGMSIVWVVDEETLKEQVSGIHKRDFNTVLQEFPHITRAEVSIRPFWKRAFPSNPKNIKIEQILN